jgi:RNA recognition motif-containing protein
MNINPKQQRQLFLYLYDLPKTFTQDGGVEAGVTATEIARLIYDSTGVLIEKMPIINYHRDMFKPFYSAYVCFEGATYEHNKSLPQDQRCKSFVEIREKFKYFNIKGREVRALGFDEQFLGERREETNQKQNLFITKVDKKLSHRELERQICETIPGVRVKSLKISRDERYRSKGYGFACFESEEQAKRVKESLAGAAIPWNPTPIKEIEQKVKNNIFIKEFPDTWTEEQIKEKFSVFGNISSVALVAHANGKFAFVCYSDPTEQKKDHEYGLKCA